jgi:hypothetical protein
MNGDASRTVYNSIDCASNPYALTWMFGRAGVRLGCEAATGRPLCRSGPVPEPRVRRKGLGDGASEFVGGRGEFQMTFDAAARAKTARRHMNMHLVCTDSCSDMADVGEV